MALYKPIKQEDGVTVNYHRILFIQITTNKQNSIAVLSYVDNESRSNDGMDPMINPYKHSVTYEVPYDESMTVESAYEYLKTLPQFEGAEDV